MEICTSYWNNRSNFGKFTPVLLESIRPPYYTGDICKILAPISLTASKFRKEYLTRNDYVKAYTDYLNTRDIHWVIEDLSAISDKIVLIDYQKSLKIGVRRIVANWLSEQLSMDIPEL